MAWFAGIDYSMTSPAMVTFESTDDIYQYYYMSTAESKLKSDSKLYSALIDVPTTVSVDILEGTTTSSIKRFQNIANFFLKTINLIKPNAVFLEGYSLGSQGKVFSIAENTAILKGKLYDGKYTVVTLPPTVVKKFATGKGNASKQMMKEVFFENERESLTDLKEVSHYKESPFTDLIDAYYVLKYGIHYYLDKEFIRSNA